MGEETMSEEQINDICKAFVQGSTIEDIASIEQLPVTDVAQLLKDNAEKVQQLKTFYKSMGVI